MKKNVKNYGWSVKERLLNLMKSSNQPYMYLLSRYFNERLLYRVSVSEYRDHFILKGGSLLYAIDGLATRPTIDVDFMADRIDSDRETLRSVFADILAIPCVEDGVVFDVGTLDIEPIAIDKKYPGTRLLFTAHLDSIVHPMSLDIGFGDVVTPYPIPLDYPTLLESSPSVNLYAYSLETMIAEKFHTMVDRDESNSRMKDFFDVYQLFTNHDIDMEVLNEAIKSTFSNRNTHYHTHLKLFTEEFATDSSRNKMWQSFLKKIHWKNPMEFTEVMTVIKANLYSFWTDKL